MDHTIEKRFPKAILENLKQLDPANAKRAEGNVAKSDQRADRAAEFNAALHARKAKDQSAKGRSAGKATAVKDEGAASFGSIGEGDYTKIPDQAPHFPAVAVYHANHVKQKGLKSHTDIIEQARKTSDPHGHLKSSLKSQIDLEEKAMLAQMDADKTAPPEVKSRMKAGVAAAKAENVRLYGLGAAKARAVKDEEKNDNTAKENSSVLGFEGGMGAPNFLVHEGVGGPYRDLQKIKSPHFERDHIVDKSYPLNAKELNFLSDSEHENIAAAVTDKLRANNQRLSPARRDRLATLGSAPLYSDDTGMAKYTEGDGYAIMLYRPPGKTVTKNTGSTISQADLAAAAGRIDVQTLVDYVIDGTDANRASAIKDKRTGVAGTLRARAVSHTDHVADQYSKQLKKVPEMHEPDAKNIAKLHMVKIAARVQASLATARSKTEELF
jgi:hypothetical protein